MVNMSESQKKSCHLEADKCLVYKYFSGVSHPSHSFLCFWTVPYTMNVIGWGGGGGGGDFWAH